VKAHEPSPHDVPGISPKPDLAATPGASSTASSGEVRSLRLAVSAGRPSSGVSQAVGARTHGGPDGSVPGLPPPVRACSAPGEDRRICDCDFFVRRAIKTIAEDLPEETRARLREQAKSKSLRQQLDLLTAGAMKSYVEPDLLKKPARDYQAEMARYLGERVETA
jgi:hypothetical protein